ncbi:protein-disulfide reductase DsbD N-terminal domain-containing protein [Chitinophagaceae bacterium LB-8]|uniref:Protein-disulfide reductase DsbD N-terminal domain-containing protein n=1 Tax=Paraflavisolibacter caeni TaxID=2982496 RepID=A0A9X3BGR1_9BACT|nr:protein-disulfide reductase DsbD domain-containing protein [Paraflavisolibacter caeni]MCU7548003.1 protein-disulfide reductase DsbD N-terminal domain-containing protein [Paraflavisolibacter caeni]
MRKIFVIASLLFGSLSFAQQSPVSWAFSSKKISPTIYEIHLTASILPGWHLYSQNQPDDAIAVPTSFSFSKNPLLQFDGAVKEVGKLEKFRDEKLDVSANQYSQKVNFIQKVTVKGKAKTAVAGKLEFQTCDDKKCLPPKTVNFTVALN